jgi:hypothetical protein
MCTDRETPGLPLGANCLRGSCADGFCLELDGVPVCSGSCRLGSPGCGFDPRSPDRLEAYCLYEATPSSTEGDLGLCATLCDCDSDCLHEDLVCEPGPPDSSIVLSARGRRGACTPASVARTHLDCNGDAGVAEGGTPEASSPEAGDLDAGTSD